MRPGPPPLPTRLKLLRGNPGKRALNHNEPQPRTIRIPCPRVLTGPARKEWHRVAPMLHRLGLFTEADREALTALCRAYGEWLEALKELDKTSAVVKSPSGYPMMNPWIIIAARAERRWSRLLPEFGMTPSSRSRIGVNPPPLGPRDSDDLDDLLD
jgi:P27 family predicted phage terminase small subunit